MTRASDTARILSGGTVINEDSNDVDLRVEGNGDANLLVCDAGSDFVAIGETSQINGGKLNIATSAEGVALSMLCRSTTDSHQPEIVMQKSSTDSGNFAATADGESLGSIKFRGVNTSAVSDIGAEISVVQDGTSGSTVPTTMRFSTNETERMRLTSDGQFLVGCTASGANEGVTIKPNNSNGACTLFFDRASSTSSSTVLNFENGNQTVGSIAYSNSGTSFNTSSDYRLKENIVTEWDATTRLKQLKPSRFNFIDDKDTTVDGFIAHEVSDIVPEAISGKKDAMRVETRYTEHDKETQGDNPTKKVGDAKTYSKTEIEPQGIDQSKLVPLLVKTIQELEARIAILESK
jgi:hypothetical protein